MTERPRLVLNVERREQLRAFGLSSALIDGFASQETDPLARYLWAGNGEALAELEERRVFASVRAKTIVPVCQRVASAIDYVLLVRQRDSDRGMLVHLTDEDQTPIRGDIVGFLTDAVCDLWESESFDDDALIAWAARMGFPSASDLVRELPSAPEGKDEYVAWLDTFVARHAAK